jgi:hypothetical protein
MRRLPFAVLFFAPLAAMAGTPCEYQAPRHLQLDLTGVRGVQIEVNSHTLHVRGGDANGLTLDGRACASDAASLASLQVTHRREGDQLILDMGGDSGAVVHRIGGVYRDLEATVQLPANLPLRLDVGSGDADAQDLGQLRGSVGSGDLRASRIAGVFDASVGSGDIDASDIGRLNLGSVGSGDVRAKAIKGDVRIGSIGSGDVSLDQVGGSVRADTLGSGDLKVRDVAGDFTLGAKGSGDVDHRGVKGRIDVPHSDDD